uniref:Uncharacterized protein n=1 Tax=Opuntia streptacantha TaxID=393608 RepID=A0A7C9D7E8_OPUST
MSKFEGQCEVFPITSPNISSDWDGIYKTLKSAYADLIAAKNTGYDDRTKLVMFSITGDWNEWALLFYNQNRLAVSNATYIKPWCPTVQSAIQLPTGISQISDQTVNVAARIDHLQSQINELQTLLSSTTSVSAKDE